MGKVPIITLARNTHCGRKGFTDSAENLELASHSLDFLDWCGVHLRPANASVATHAKHSVRYLFDVSDHAYVRSIVSIVPPPST